MVQRVVVGEREDAMGMAGHADDSSTFLPTLGIKIAKGKFARNSQRNNKKRTVRIKKKARSNGRI